MKKQKLSSLKTLIAFVSLTIIIYASIVIYEQYKASIPPAVESKLIYDTRIMLDNRVNVKYGSYAGHTQLHAPQTVELVYKELQNRLTNKQQVILLDIGANTGSFALLPVLSKQIKVIAFEPNLEVADILRANVEFNDLIDNVTIFPIGISNKTAIVDLQIPIGKHSGLATMGANVLRFNPANGYSSAVYVTSLDELSGTILKKGERIDVVKIDTEGWEYYILLGAIKTLQAHRPAILLEFNQTNMQQAGVDPKNLQDLLDKLQYNCTLLRDDLFCQPTKVD